MRINLNDIIRRATLPEMPPDEVERRAAKIRQAAEIGGIAITGAVESILPMLARYSQEGPETGKLVVPLPAMDGSREWEMRRREDLAYATETRGIMLLGSIGTGKTIAMEILSAMFGTPILSMVRLGAAFKTGGVSAAQEILDSHDRADLICDDIGAETEARSYGDRLTTRDIVMQRYEQWRKMGVRTHYTANLTPEQLLSEAVLGKRAYDRIAEMCVVVVATGKSMRRKQEGSTK